MGREALTQGWIPVYTCGVCLAAVRRPIVVAPPTLVPPKQEGGAARGENIILWRAPAMPCATLLALRSILIAPGASLGHTAAAAERAVAGRVQHRSDVSRGGRWRGRVRGGS
jgi:hypothetical protein